MREQEVASLLDRLRATEDRLYATEAKLHTAEERAAQIEANRDALLTRVEDAEDACRKAEERARRAEKEVDQLRMTELPIGWMAAPRESLERENAALRERLEKLEVILRNVLDESGVQAHLIGCPQGMRQAHARYKRAILFEHCAGCAGEAALSPSEDVDKAKESE